MATPTTTWRRLARRRDRNPLRRPADLSHGPRVAAQAMDFAAHRRLQMAVQERGVYFHPSPIEPWFLSTAHSPDDLDQVLAVVRDALASVPESR